MQHRKGLQKREERIPDTVCDKAFGIKIGGQTREHLCMEARDHKCHAICARVAAQTPNTQPALLSITCIHLHKEGQLTALARLERTQCTGS